MSHKHRKQKKWMRLWGWEISVALLSVILSLGMQKGSFIQGYLIEQIRDRHAPQMSQFGYHVPAPKPARSSSSAALRKTNTAARRAAAREKRILQRVYLGGQQASLHAAPAEKLPQGPMQGVQRAAEQGVFPSFEKTVFPVSKVPNWGTMHGAAEWGRSYNQMAAAEFVAVPAYDVQKLVEPFNTFVKANDEKEITRKLFYSTKFFGAYDLDSPEYAWIHPGVDLKLALGTPISAIAGGRVHAVLKNSVLGLHVILEHRHSTDGTFFSIYGHLGATSVREGEDVRPGHMIGVVGMTGNTTAPHLHLQIDRKRLDGPHQPYRPTSVPKPGDAETWTMHPIHFIEKYDER